MKLCSVIIAAYNTPEYILSCVESFNRQQPTPGWVYDLRIGVDGCEKTAETLDRHGIKYFYSPENVGAYIMRNSLLAIGEADAYSVFDSDDIMYQEYLARSLKALSTGAIMTAKINCDVNMKPGRMRLESGGAITFTDEARRAVGGYQPYRCACDTDFMYRLRLAGFQIKKLQAPLYFRRNHPEQLTKVHDYGYHSEYRREVWAKMTEARENGTIKIFPETVKLLIKNA